MDSLETNKSFRDFLNETENLQQMKIRLNEIFEISYAELRQIHRIDRIINLLDTIAVRLDDQAIMDIVHELHRIMSLLDAYNIAERLSYIPCPTIFLKIHDKIDEALRILRSYANHNDDLVFTEPEYFNFPEDPEARFKKYTIHLSAVCHSIELVNDSLEKIADELAHEVNQITSEF